MSELYARLHTTATLRKAGVESEISDMNAMAGIYDGDYPAEYEKYFPVGTPRHDVNFISLAWDDLAQTTARSPEVQADAINSSDTALRKSQKFEKIVQGYFQNARPYQSMFLFQNAWNLVGLGRAVSIVVPDKDKRTPRFEARDPRTSFPGAKRMIGQVYDELTDIIFYHEMPRDEAVSLGFAAKNDSEGNMLTSDVVVYEYLDDQIWAMSSAYRSTAVRHGLGMVPAVYMQTFSPNKTGKSQFEEQIALMIATSRIITQKMAYLDRVIYPITWVKNVEGEMTLGPNSVTVLGDRGEIGQLAPPAQLQVDRDLNTLERYQRILNRNPEVRQGEVDGKGAYVGNQTLETLNDSVESTVSRFWDSLQAGYEKLAAIALEMDEKLFGGEQKSISVVMKGQRSVETYEPLKDIAGRREVRVAYGFGVGGSYQSFLENVQSYQAELVPKRRAVESMPGVSDANRVMRELELDKMDNIAFEGFLAMSQQGQLDMALWAKYRKKMENRGLSWHDAFLEYEEEFKQQATEASQEPIPASGVTQPQQAAPAPEEQLQGVPPSALMGG